MAKLWNFIIICTLPAVRTESPVDIYGSGATFPEEVYSQWRSAFKFKRSEFVDVEMQYVRGGSRLGLFNMMQNDPPGVYGGTELDLTALEAAANPNLRMVPVLASGIAMVYNIPGGPQALVLSREAIVGIFDGSITRWDDAEIVRHNPNTWMPGENIIPIARADTSGCTEIFTRTLSSISTTWANTYGVFREGLSDFFNTEEPIHWNSSVVKYFGRTNRGMTGMIYSYRYSIGYVSIGEALIANQTCAHVINKQNNTVFINVSSINDVMEEKVFSVNPTSVVSMVDSDLPNAYPFLGLSYFLIDMEGVEGCTKARELYFYMEWILTDSTAMDLANTLYYSGMLPEVADHIINHIMSDMKCENGKSVLALVNEQKDHERWIRRTPLRIGISVGVSVGVLLLAGFIAYVIVQHVRVRKALKAGEWNISVGDIDVKWDRNKGWNYPPAGKFSDFGSTFTGMKSMVSDGAFSQPWSLLIVKYGKWNNKAVCLRKFPKDGFRLSKENAKLVVMNMTTRIIHTNVLRFLGVTEFENELHLVGEHAEKGCLTDVLQNTRYKLDDNFMYALALDVAQGMDFLHSHHIIHGSLSSECCLLDCRWNVKITQWEILNLYTAERERKLSRVHPVYVEEIQDKNLEARANMWTAPEILQGLVRAPNKKGDVYSFGILMVEIFSREDPYSDQSDTMEPTDIIEAIIKDGLRPDLSAISNKKIKPLMMSSWQDDPHKRPCFSNLVKELRHRKSSRKSVIESMMDTLEEYVVNLEEKVQERTAELAGVNKSLENLLHQILPASVARSLSKGETVKPEQFGSSTIFFSDIVGFTTLCAQSSPLEVVNLLNDLYTMFDSVIDKLDVYKVETIGDAYMCISGVPIRNGILHADNIATMALRLLQSVKTFRIRHRPANERLQLRAGIHSGPVVAGVVGVKMPRYCLFGDTVNTASRMESTSVAMRIQISNTTHALLAQLGGYEYEDRGKVSVKGKGEMNTYFLLGTRSESTQLPTEQNDPPNEVN